LKMMWGLLNGDNFPFYQSGSLSISSRAEM
jgi:hypothetical protein